MDAVSGIRPVAGALPVQRRGSRAFTLIELMVVVAIIALLMSLLLPALAGAKDQANRTYCKANIKSLCMAMREYLTEWDNTFPPNGIIFPKANAMNGGKGYGHADSNQDDYRPPHGALWPIINGIGKVYLCPTDVGTRSNQSAASVQNGTGVLRLNPSPIGSKDFSANGFAGTIGVGPAALGQGYWSYSVNTVLNSEGRFRASFPLGVPWTDPLKLTSVRNESEFVFIVEEDDGSLFNDEVFEPPAYSNGDRLSGRHLHTGNIGFADGHVDTYSEVLFNQVPSGIVPGNAAIDHVNAMKSPYTRLFFPDHGEFADAMSPATGP